MAAQQNSTPWTKPHAAEALAWGDFRYADSDAGPGVEAKTNEYVPRQGPVMPGPVYQQPGFVHAPQVSSCHYHCAPTVQESYSMTLSPLPYTHGQYYCYEQPPPYAATFVSAAQEVFGCQPFTHLC